MHFLGRSILPALLCACLSANALELLTEDDPPHNMLKNGTVVGISTEKLEEAFKRIGVTSSITLVPWARAYQSALTQPGHCAFSAARTAEREALFKWIGPVAAMDWVLYGRADQQNPRPERLEDVREETIGGYLQDVISVSLAGQGYHVETVPNDEFNPKKLLLGRIDYWASSRPRATALLAKAGLSKQIVPVLTFGHTDLYLACHLATPDKLVKQLNAALRRMRDDGTAGRIDARYRHP